MSFIVQLRDSERASQTRMPTVKSRNDDVASATHKAYLHGRLPSFVPCHHLTKLQDMAITIRIVCYDSDKELGIEKKKKMANTTS